MNKIIVLIAVVLSVVLINLGLSSRAQIDELRTENTELESGNLEMKQRIKDKELLPKKAPVPLSVEYNVVMNQIRILESYGGTSMNVQLDNALDVQDISSRYVETEYKGIRGLKIKIVVDKFSHETDMGAVLDDIHLLEKNTDFVASEISKDNNTLIVKGEVYGL